MSKCIHGTVDGNSIRCDEQLGLADGTQVEIVIKPVVDQIVSRDRLTALFGSCSDDAASLDEYLKENAVQRRRTRRELAE